jgi:DNA-binding NarL/FixJ family response regulator
MARRGEEIRPFNWVMQPGPGGERAARVSVTKVGADRRGRYTLVHAIHANGAERSPLRRAAAKAGLSAREQEVLSAVSRGLRNRDIAGELGISPATVRNHVQNITQKLGVRSKLEAMALVLRRANGDGRV